MKARKITLSEEEIPDKWDNIIAKRLTKTILFNLCGHGNFDMKAYEDYFAGNIVGYELITEEINVSRTKLDTSEIE